ncbi:RodZ domain-containing protein [Marinobacter daepoensis]|uniref:RodZ domain-containing protein n=1 Tax=Marinobacter daepoensis TaxID=262077 RepID=UPI00041F0F04|nr:RodZ family helix-turn-helix domain-containing protein [Marinobacter daepoensis]
MTGEEQSQPAAGTSVGQQLRQAREKLGLNVSDIANLQHLRPSVIQAIEAGDYSKVDTELFLKGYVRTYARQVGLDADALIRTLDSELEPLRQRRVQEQQSNPLIDIERKKKRKRQFAKLTLLLVFVAVVGFLVYDHFLKPGPEQVTPAADIPEEASAPLVDESVPGEDIPAETRVSSASIAEAPIVSPEPGVVTENTDTAPSAISQEPASAEPEMAVGGEATETAGPLTTDTEVSVVAQSESVDQENLPGLVRLEMNFSNDCWVQVTDADGKRLVSALRRDGDALDVQGRAPLRVVVGAMNAVESLRFEGESMDLGSFRVVNNRSEFTLEP